MKRMTQLLDEKITKRHKRILDQEKSLEDLQAYLKNTDNIPITDYVCYMQQQARLHSYLCDSYYTLMTLLKLRAEYTGTWDDRRAAEYGN